MTQKQVYTVTNTYQTMEGGLEIRRAFPGPALDFQDPFILLDHMGPMQIRPGQMKGVSSHPHRGFETVTYVFEGEFHHEDSAGNSGDIGPGDVQWMTAGSGIVHSEFPSQGMSETGGTMHGLQLWVNLPASKKMIPPAYQGIKSDGFPLIQKEWGTLKVIGGSYNDNISPVTIQSELGYYHLHIRAQSKAEITIPEGWMSLVYNVNGSIKIGEYAINEAQIAKMQDSGEEITIENTSQKSIDIMVLSGKPIAEPIAAHGPFVMNYKHEILQAIEDYQAGKFM